MGFKQAFLKCIVFDPNQYALAGLHLLVMKFHGDQTGIFKVHC